ncbi:MAG: S1/P1 nuclease [Gemmatimonadales bacterium]
MYPFLHGFTLLLMVSGAATPPTAPATLWFALGHRVVARIAEGRLTPHTADAVRQILGGQTMADASVWADQIRGQRRSTSALHFVNIPLEASAYEPAGSCPEGRCIIGAIESDRRILADPASSSIDRAEALRFLIHFIGDLHQPLHVSNNGDHGGNDTQVQFFGRGSNLHQVWDGQLIEQAGMDEARYLAHLMPQLATLDLAEFEQGTVVEWAMEGHRTAIESAYRLPPRRQLTESYEEMNLPIVDLAVIKAGVRLAKVLNDALAAYEPGAAPAKLGAGIYSDREAAAHAGEEAMVVGVVVSVHRSAAGNLYLNFGADYPHQTFSGAVLKPTAPGLRDLDGLAGKRVGIRGLIKLYKGQAEIVVEREEQIVVMP